jgi:subtilisin family serine protease
MRSLFLLLAVLISTTTAHWALAANATTARLKGLRPKKSIHAKIPVELEALQEELETARARSGAAFDPTRFRPANPLIPVTEGRVIVDAVAAGDVQALRRDLEGLGMKPGGSFGRVLSGQLPISAISAAAALDSLKHLRPAYAATRAGSVQSQAAVVIGTDAASSTFGVSGSGITVGTLSDSFDCLGGAAGDVASGDLPQGIIVLSEEGGCGSGSDEGRAMMQLIHDIAPGADQAFHSAFNGQADFAFGIVELAGAAGARVIVDDVFYFAEPFFQDGIIAQAVDLVVNAGIAYFSAAGNSARESYESPFRPSGLSVVFEEAEAHDFDPGPGVDVFQKITVPEGTAIQIGFQWDQPFFSVSGDGSASDIDIFVTDEPPTVVLAESITNNLGGDPVEIINVINPAGSGATQFNIVIERFAGPNPGLLKYIRFSSGITVNEYDTQSSTVFGHPNAAGAAAVGAAFYFLTPAFGFNPPILESFSSSGPTPILFRIDGTPTLEVRDKPRIVAPDGTNTTFFGSDVENDGSPNFFGTSAAAPHAAGAAALLLEAVPSLSPSDLYSLLESTALDIDSPFNSGFPDGFDYESGFGLIQIDAALGEAQPVICPSTPLQGCRTALKNTLLLKHEGSKRDRLVWKWLRGQTTTQEEFGDPANSTQYVLCIYTGSQADLTAAPRVPVSDSAWSTLGSSAYLYKDTAASVNGLQKIVLQPSNSDRTKITFNGKGKDLPDLPAAALALPVTVQLVNNETGVCWESRHAADDVIKNDSNFFKVRASE